MTVMTEPAAQHRPPSPWRGSEHHERHRWQLDHAADLPAVAAAVRDLADQLSDAHTAGWWLEEPMRTGHLHAARRSRRQRARPTAAAHPDFPSAPPVQNQQHAVGHWRIRLVDEPAVDGEAVFDPAAAPKTPLLAVTGGSGVSSSADGSWELIQVAGPALEGDALEELVGQLGLGERAVRSRRWGVAPARVGPGFDLVAEGSPLRGHAVQAGGLVRTRDALSFQHAADGAADLAQAAACYRWLAVEVQAVIATGGRLVSADDGLVVVDYPHPPLLPRSTGLA